MVTFYEYRFNCPSYDKTFKSLKNWFVLNQAYGKNGLVKMRLCDQSLKNSAKQAGAYLLASHFANAMREEWSRR